MLAEVKRGKMGSGPLSCAVLALAIGGLTSSALAGWFDKKASHEQKPVQESRQSMSSSARVTVADADLPPNAEPGECYAKAYIPATFKTVTERRLIKEASEQIEIVPGSFKWVEERMLVKEASEKIEVVPAEYKWVEERILVKEASTQLEAVPAETKWTEQTIEVSPARTGWVVQKAADCVSTDKEHQGEIYCLKTTPAEYKTIKVQCVVKPPCVRQVAIPAEYQTVRKQVVACPAKTRKVCIPAEYQTVRRQVVACPATTKKICIPAEYQDVQKTVLVCPERVKWEHIVCKERLTAATVNEVKTALLASGFKPGPMNGELGKQDWAALNAFQQVKGLGVGQLSYETMKQLKISID